MTRKLRPQPRGAKSAKSQIRNQSSQIRNPSAAVMQKVKALVKPRNVAHELNYFTGVPVPSAQKMMSGDRPINLAVVVGLLRSEHGREVLFELMGDARPDWFVKYQGQLDINATRKQLLESQRLVEELQAKVL